MSREQTEPLVEISSAGVADARLEQGSVGRRGLDSATVYTRGGNSPPLSSSALLAFRFVAFAFLQQ